jgi:hypothetical protein
MNASDKKLRGRLVYLTTHVDIWLRQVNPKFNVPMANRIAKIHKIFDWANKEGKILLREREKIGKWTELDPKDFKYVLKIYYPELKKGSKAGITLEEIFPRKFPGTELNMFEPLPEWMLKDLQREEKNAFSLVENDSPKSHNLKKRSSGNRK